MHIPLISIWNRPDDLTRKLEFSCNDGEAVVLKGTLTDENGMKWIHIRDDKNREGWVKYWFVKEYK